MGDALNGEHTPCIPQGIEGQDNDIQALLVHTGQIITHIERLMEDARKEIERIADEETDTDSRG